MSGARSWRRGRVGPDVGYQALRLLESGSRCSVGLGSGRGGGCRRRRATARAQARPRGVADRSHQVPTLPPRRGSTSRPRARPTTPATCRAGIDGPAAGPRASAKASWTVTGRTCGGGGHLPAGADHVSAMPRPCRVPDPGGGGASVPMSGARPCGCSNRDPAAQPGWGLAGELSRMDVPAPMDDGWRAGASRAASGDLERVRGAGRILAWPRTSERSINR